jgi:hypothetical protein
MRSSLLLVALSLCSLQAAAQWNENGAPLPDTPSTKSKDGFGAMLLLSDEPNRFVEEWQSTPPDHRPTLRTTDRAPRNRQVVAFLFFSGCRPANGACDCSVDFTVVRPDGSTYAERSNLELWRGKAPTPGSILQLSVANLAITIETRDPLGTYTIKAKVKDNVAGTVLELTTPLEAVAHSS